MSACRTQGRGWTAQRSPLLLSAFVLGSMSSMWAMSSAIAQRGPTAILSRVRVNPRRQIDFHAAIMSDSVFVGQQATYQVAVLLSADARSRLRRNPEFLPPELRGLLAYELGTPTRVAPQNYAGAVFEAHVFQRALFPVVSGVQTVPAPQLTYSLPQSSSYFSREERFVVRAESASFVVKPLPAYGRPDDFNGAVGQFTSTARIDTAVARVGDPIILTLRVQGTGNVKLLPRPVLELNWATVVAGSERIQVDSSGTLVRGSKEFDWILTPARDGPVDVPSLRYSYFDPYAAQYAVAESPPVSLVVKSGTLAVVEEGEGADVIPLRPAHALRQRVIWNGREAPPRSWSPWLLPAVLAPLLGAAVALRRRVAGRNAFGERPLERAEIRVDVAPETPRDALRLVRRTLLASIAERFSQSPQAILSRTQLIRVLRRAGVTQNTTRETVALLDRLDAVSFSEVDGLRAPPNAEAAQREADVLLRDIEAQALPRGRELRATALAVLAVTLLVSAMMSSALAGQSPSRPQRDARPTLTPAGAIAQNADIETLLADARVAYEQRAYLEATERFGIVAQQFPGDADVLVNWGTAAWAANDTVTAVIAWHRAARREPLATDVARRLDLLPSGARGGVADVPMIPVPWLLRGAFALWCVGWLLWSWSTWRAGRNVTRDSLTDSRQQAADSQRFARPLRRVARAMIALGAAAGLSAWWGVRALDPQSLYVVSRPETLRIAPGSDADAMGGVSTGDVVKVVESRPFWHRVHHADGRRGWLPSARLVAVAAERSTPTRQ